MARDEARDEVRDEGRAEGGGKGRGPGGCCAGADEATRLKKAVQEHYAARARGAGSKAPSCCGAGSPAGASYLEQIGYRPGDLDGVPTGASSCSAGCGNPLEGAELKPGEVVLDIGSGGGLDAILAARQVGPAGRVIGLDFTPDMLDLARRNVAQAGLANVEFRHGDAEHMPVADSSIDVIISNCVINLAPDKRAVFREACRVLRPGGRLVISDIVTNGIPPGALAGLEAWVECVGGALPEDEYLGAIRAAGFETVGIWKRADYDTAAVRDALAAAAGGACCADGDLREAARRVVEILERGGRVSSVNVRAVKGGAERGASR